jgi:hypothetical protein
MKSKNKIGKFGSVLEIVIIIISIIAFSYLVNPHDVVQAAAPASEVCCEKTKSGAWCQTAKQSDCNSSLLSSPTGCDSTAFCKLGCCFDSSEGTCSPNTAQRTCQSNGGTWADDAECLISQCQPGCCILGTQAAFTTLTSCRKLSGMYNMEVNFNKNIPDELTCISLASLSDQGACVFEVDYQKTCKFASRQECNNIGGQSAENITSNVTFYKDTLCSSEELGTNCALTQRTVCVPGKDGVYFVDKCGNPANIYDSEKVTDKAYWNKVVKVEDSCGYGNTNGNKDSKTCGNCDYFSGSMCKTADRTNRATYGDNICKNLDCKLADGTIKRNGETWCDTDKPSGKLDTAGSRYFRHICMNGEEIIEPCADFRQEVCVEDNIVANGAMFSQGNCVVNRWASCSAQNTSEDCLNNATGDCKWQAFNTGAEIFGALKIGPGGVPIPGKATGLKPEYSCVPANSPGLQFWNDDTQAQGICSQGTTTCNVKYKLGFPEYDWYCADNCQCLSQTWQNEQNLKCQSYGDCGGKVNYIGSSGEKGFKFSIAGIFLPILKSVTAVALFVVGGAKGIVSSLTPVEELVNQILAIPANTQAITSVTTPLPALGTAGVQVTVPGFAPSGLGSLNPLGSLAPTTPTTSAPAMGVWAWMKTPGPGQALVWAAIMYAAAYMFAKAIGLSTAQANQLGISAAVGTITYEAILIAAKNGAFAISHAAAFGWAFLAAVVVFVLIFKDEKTKVVTFECLPYTPPVKGSECEKCNTDKYPCTDYRCRSLGQACLLTNVGTNHELCVWNNTRDVLRPTITPDENALTPGYKYVTTGISPPGRGVEIKKENGGCIEPFTALTFGLTTNEPAKCRIDYNDTGSFENLSYSFGGSYNAYNHTQTMSLAGPDVINSLPNISIRNSGLYNLYVRCEDMNGNANVEPYIVKFCIDPTPDLAAPTIVSTSILNGAPVKYNANSTPFEVYTNKPSECKWSKVDQDYSRMENTMKCDTSISQMNAQLLYTCRTTLTGLKNSADNTFFFRCKSYPGLDESKRFTNSQSQPLGGFVLKGTQPLNIISAGPKETIKGSTTLVPVYLTAETANGFNFGDSTCYYGTSSSKINVPFLTTGTNLHSQRQDLPSGTYTYYIKCIDLGGNSDTKQVKFSVVVDQQAPRITSAYNLEGQMIVKTNEISTCSYSTNAGTGCNFQISEGTSLPYDNSTSHSTEWIVGKTFYIKCSDTSGNEPAGNECSIIVKTIQ